MTLDEYNKIPIVHRIEAGDTILFLYPGTRPEHGIKVESVYETMDHGKKIMMAQEKERIVPCLKQLEITAGKKNHTVYLRRHSYDLDYCKIEYKGDFEVSE